MRTATPSEWWTPSRSSEAAGTHGHFRFETFAIWNHLLWLMSMPMSMSVLMPMHWENSEQKHRSSSGYSYGQESLGHSNTRRDFEHFAWTFLLEHLVGLFRSDISIEHLVCVSRLSFFFRTFSLNISLGHLTWPFICTASVAIWMRNRIPARFQSKNKFVFNFNSKCVLS